MGKKIKKYHSTLTIKRKLLIINAIIVIVPIVFIGTIITGIYQNTVNKRTRQSVADSSVVISDRITRVLKDAENCSNYLTVNINEVLKSNELMSEISLRKQKDVTNELYKAKIIFDEIESIAFVSVNNQIFASDYTMLKNKELVLDSTQLGELEKTSGKSIWFPCEAREFLVSDLSKPVLTLGKKVVKITTGETLGYIFVNVDIGQIENILNNQLINYRLEDKVEKLVSSVISSDYIDEQDVKALLNQIRECNTSKYEGRNYYIASNKIENYDWELTAIVDLNEFNVGANKILYLIVVIAFVLVVVEILLYNYLSRIITVPLQKLKTGAEEIAGGNMNLRLHFKTEDEIGKLGDSFNYMTEQVQELLNKVDYEARKKQEYELSLLHEQVKPHFLYNSLDIITKLSEMNRHVEARRAIRKLADYYRNSLSDSKEIISIDQEIKIVEDYLELQIIRYNDVFTYEVDVEEVIREMLIPKLSLQPLIENAIYHGLKYKESKGVLKIIGRKLGREIIISVLDNGVGMTEESVQSITRNQPDGHFGVYSVNHRIKLYFGELYGVKVESVLGTGTKVDINLPNTLG